jgi:homoserine/homoserine lactone efflux protein
MILIIAGAGVGSLLLASEVAFNAVKIVGALYLIYLGVNQWRARINVDDTSPHLSAAADVPSWRKRLMTGFLTNATNPKGIIFMVAVLPQFITSTAALLPQLIILGITMCAIDLMVMHTYALAASSMQRYFRDPRAMKKQNRFFGGVLMAVGGALFFVKRGTS